MKHVLFTISLIFGATAASAENEISLKQLEAFAKQGDLAAQIELANAYRKGIGVTQDYKTAVKWFTLAAEQGDPPAQYNLGRLYYLGKGVPENLVYAHMWAEHASLNGFTMATDLKNLLTELMTENQISEANRLGKECKDKKYKGC